MDELLKQNPSQLSDERREMFALADRFSAAVKAYQRQYVSIAEKKNKDLQQRSLDKKNHLDRLRELQESERRRLSEECRKRSSRLTDRSPAGRARRLKRCGCRKNA